MYHNLAITLYIYKIYYHSKLKQTKIDVLVKKEKLRRPSAFFVVVADKAW
jgi:hypothetical protein